MFDPKEVATFCAGLVALLALLVLFVWGNYRALAEKYDHIKERYEHLKKLNDYLTGRLHTSEQQPQRKFAVFIQKNPNEQATTESLSPQARALLESAAGLRANGHPGASASVPGGEKTTAKVARAEGPPVHPFPATTCHTAPGLIPHSEVPKRADRG